MMDRNNGSWIQRFELSQLTLGFGMGFDFILQMGNKNTSLCRHWEFIWKQKLYQKIIKWKNKKVTVLC